MYLGWYDPDRKKAVERKLEAAIARYERKWNRRPTVALVNTVDAVELAEFPGVEVRAAAHVAPNTFFVGDDDPEEDELAA